jgi:hypothetical protein
MLPLVQLIPWKHFGRKNVGFLYAILHGAKASRNNVKHVKGTVTRDILGAFSPWSSMPNENSMQRLILYLTVLYREIFATEIFISSKPIWIPDLRTRRLIYYGNLWRIYIQRKNRIMRMLSMCLIFQAHAQHAPNDFKPMRAHCKAGPHRIGINNTSKGIKNIKIKIRHI